MKKLFASVLCVVVAVSLSPTLSAAGRPIVRVTAQPGQNIGEISGKSTKDGKPLAKYKVQLRNIDTKALVGDMVTDAGGNFKFTGLPVGNYVVETVDDNGNIIATSATLSLAVGAMLIGNVGVGASAAVAGGVAAGGAALSSTTLIVTLAAVGAGVTAAVVAVTNDASASGG